MARRRTQRPRAPYGSSLKPTAVQHARENIRCNSVHPGPIETDMLREAAGGREEAYRQRVPLGRFGTVEGYRLWCVISRVRRIVLRHWQRVSD